MTEAIKKTTIGKSNGVMRVVPVMMVHFDFYPKDRVKIRTLEHRLERAIQHGGVGELGECEFHVDGNDGYSYMYGPGSDRFDMVAGPILRSSKLMIGAEVTAHYGPCTKTFVIHRDGIRQRQSKRNATTHRMLLAAVLASAFTSAHAHTLCTVVTDPGSGKILMEKGDRSMRTMLASTFKVAISLMGHDSGFLKDAHTPTLQFRQGYPDWGGAAWKQPIDPTSWIKYSVAWFSPQVTKSLGMGRFSDDAKRFDSGNADVTGDKRHPDGLTHAWIDSSLQISPLEQIAFLTKLVNHRLHVSEHAYAMTEQITGIAQYDGWVIYGKTGTGFPANADGSDDRTRGWGWFVGLAKRDGKTLVFARLVQADGTGPRNTPVGLRARDTFLAEFQSRIAPLASKSS
jgi:beta-lactamase class D